MMSQSDARQAYAHAVNLQVAIDFFARFNDVASITAVMVDFTRNMKELGVTEDESFSFAPFMLGEGNLHAVSVLEWQKYTQQAKDKMGLARSDASKAFTRAVQLQVKFGHFVERDSLPDAVQEVVSFVKDAEALGVDRQYAFGFARCVLLLEDISDDNVLVKNKCAREAKTALQLNN